MEYRVAVGIALAVVLGAVAMLFPRISSAPVVETASDSPADFSFEIVSTPEARERGLSGRAEIKENYGMLFVFDSPGRYGIWMRDMLVPIDIIWLTKEGKILGIEHEVSPDTFPTIFYPPSPASFVLETRAGEARRLEWSEGTMIDLP